MAKHRDLAGRFISYVISSDAARAWLRRMARDPNVNPWLLLDQLTTGDNAALDRVCAHPGGTGRVCYPPTSTDGTGLVDGTVKGGSRMHGQTCTARQASMGGHARHVATADRAVPAIDGTARQPGNPVRIPPLADPQGNDVTGRWPLRSFLELGALPSAVPCARLHTRQLLWEWGHTAISQNAELLVSEIVTNAIQITEVDARTTPVRLWLLADRALVLLAVWDASPLPPMRVSIGDDAENGRGLLLVETLSTRWDHFPHHSGGKVVWAVVGA